MMLSLCLRTGRKGRGFGLRKVCTTVSMQERLVEVKVSFNRKKNSLMSFLYVPLSLESLEHLRNYSQE
jgi:hypothetical protein